MKPLKIATCEHEIWSNWRGHPCGRKAKMSHEKKWYCGIHDPVKRKAKQAARDKRWREEWDARDKADKEEKMRLDLGERAIGALEKIAAGHNDARQLAIDTLKGKSNED